MSRSILLGAASAAALCCLAAGASAQVPTTITGGGSTLAKFDYGVEFAAFNSSSPAPKAQINNINPQGGTTTYWASGSGAGQDAFLNNDITCDSSKVLNGTEACSGNTGGANSTDYGASDATLSSTQISSWASLPYGQAVSGNLIQLPSMGVAIGIPVVNSKVKTNTAVTLNDNDLCNIFTGGFTNWNQTSAKAKLTPGTITVVFRGDGSGTSFLFLNHLASVCTGASAPPAGVTLAASTTFGSIFPTTQGGIFTTPYTSSKGITYYTPANFVPQSGSNGVANYLSSLGGVTVTSAIAYLTPDFTTVDPKTNAVLSNGAKSKLVTAEVLNATNKVAYSPTEANLVTGLNNALSGQFLTPPTGSALSNPSAYVPLIQTTNTGYPIVGYTTFDLAQCYQNTNVAASIRSFLTDHFGVAAYGTYQTNNGFAPLAKTKAAGFLTVIRANILGNSTHNNLDLEDATVCKGIGR
jgi:ABC-type phosphate transport system substrate-binding protein